jgi:hypothetical protein
MSLRDVIRSVFGGKKPQEEPIEAALDAGEAIRESAESVLGGGGGVLGGVVDAALGGEGDLLGTVEAALGGLEKIAKKIPGYGGYKEKELRREADKLLRTQVAAQFDDQRKRLSELQVQLANQAQIEHLDDIERAVMKLQLLIDRIKTASYGYAGLFDAIKIKEDQLDALYQFDSQMLDFADEVAADVDRVSSAVAAKEGVSEAISGLVTTVEDANRAFGHREDAILQSVE